MTHLLNLYTSLGVSTSRHLSQNDETDEEPSLPSEGNNFHMQNNHSDEYNGSIIKY